MNSLKGSAFDLANYTPAPGFDEFVAKCSNKRGTQSATPGDPMSSDDHKVRQQCSSRVRLPINHTPKRTNKARI